MFLYQRLDSNWHTLCNLTTHNANELRNSRVAQKISEQFWFYATDCANCQSAPYTVNQLHNTQCCATWLIVNGPLNTIKNTGHRFWYFLCRVLDTIKRFSEMFYRLRYEPAWYGSSLTFRRNVLPPSSGSKSKAKQGTSNLRGPTQL
jgi:hypothetical protein